MAAMTQAQDHIEVEWQFSALDTRPVVRWLESANVPGYTLAPKPPRQVADTYFDTADWRVHRAGYTARLRRKGETAEVTLKAMAAARDGIRFRRELTEPLDHGEESPLLAPGPCGRILRALAGRQALRPLFTLDPVRQPFILGDSTGDVAELTVDETTIPVGAEAAPVRLSRVEVEVHPAAVARAQRFVDLLVVACALSPAGPSKFEAALIATGQQPMPPEKTLGATTVAAEMTAGEVAFAVLRRHFAVFLANEPGTRIGEDIEALHDMRVAARRLRAALQAFRPFLPPRMQRYRAELGWVARALGEVRDLDVQLETIATWRAGDAGQAEALASIQSLFEARREIARRRMLNALDSRRYEVVVERFAAVLRRGPPRLFAAGRVPILAVAPDLLEKRYRRLRKLGDRIGLGSPPEDYHALRIEGKRLRYALEFVGPIYGQQAIDFSRRVTALQDVLGLHQDAETAIITLGELAASAGRRLAPATVLAMGAISERYRVQAVQLRGQFAGVYKPLRGKEWRRLRALLESRRVPAIPLPAPRPALAPRMAAQHT